MELEKNLKCVLCLRKCSPGKYKRAREDTGGETFLGEGGSGTDQVNDVTATSQNQLIFLLRNVLQIPEANYCSIQKSYGDPVSWISCCDSCSNLLEDAQSLFYHITQLQNRYKMLQNEMKNTIVQSVKSERKDDNDPQCRGGIDAVRSCFKNGHIILEDIKIEESEDCSNSDLGLDHDTSKPMTTEVFSDPHPGHDHETRETMTVEVFSDSHPDEPDISDKPVGTPVKSVKLGHVKNTEKPIVKERAKKCVFNTEICLFEEQYDDCEEDSGLLTLRKDCSKIAGSNIDGNNLSRSLGGKHKIRVLDLPLKCGICDKRYELPEDLRCHMEFHEDHKKGNRQKSKGNNTNISDSPVIELVDFLEENIEQDDSTEENIEQDDSTEENIEQDDSSEENIEYNNTVTDSSMKTIGGTEEICNKRIVGDDTCYTSCATERYKCDLCDKEFVGREDLLKKHISQKSCSRIYKCLICREEFLELNLRIEHTKLKSCSKKILKCDICGKPDFKWPMDLKIHERTHTGEKPYMCGLCGKQFTQMPHLRYHERSHREKFSCDFCDKIFSNSSALEMHMETHPDKNPLTCFKCGRPFVTQQTFERHRKHCNETLDCRICGKPFSLLHSLKKHLETHKGDSEKPHQCQICSKRFPNISILRKHSNYHKSNHKCEVCGKPIPVYNRLQKHIRCCHTGKKTFKCSRCGKCYPSRGLLNGHKTNPCVERKQFHACKICDISFLNRYLLRKHMMHHIGVEPFKCGTCGEGFKSIEQLVQHQKIHDPNKKNEDHPDYENINESGETYPEKSLPQLLVRPHPVETPFVCETCGKNCQSLKDLSIHKTIHTPVMPLNILLLVSEKVGHPDKEQKCENDKIYPAKGQQVHIKTDVEEGPFVCEICGKSFAGKNNFKAHQICHSKDKPFKCQVCDKTFAAPYLLKSHTQHVHSEKDCKCQTCGQYFTELQLRKHEKIHSENYVRKSYPCELCGKLFARRTSMKHHVRIHTGEKPFVCDQCGKAFLNRTRLNTHMRTHNKYENENKDKSHECENCGKRFYNNAHLQRHFRIHTGEKPYKCEICDKAFNQSSTLKMHAKIHMKK